MELQVLGDRTLRKLAFSHVVHTIRRVNQKHKNEAHNRRLQTILKTMLEVCDGFFLVDYLFIYLFLCLSMYILIDDGIANIRSFKTMAFILYKKKDNGL